MEILDVKFLKGPNYWSTHYRQLVALKLDLQEAEYYPTNKIDGFPERLEKLMPSLYNHRCSEKRPGGFFSRVRTGTWLGHVMEHIALELQSLADMPCGFGRTRSTNKKGVYHVVFAFQLEAAGLYAAHAALRIVKALRRGEEYDIANDIYELTRIKKRDGLGPTTQAIIDEAVKRDIPVRRLDQDSLIMLGQGVNQKIIQTAMADTTSAIGAEIAKDKDQTKQILKENYIPVPNGNIVRTIEGLEEAIKDIGFPIVVKPFNGNHGRGVTTNITSVADAHAAFALAKKRSDHVIVEKFINGTDHRLLVVNYKFVAAARRIPAMVTGNGRSTIQDLIEEINNHPARGNGHENTLTAITPDESTHGLLARKDLSLDSILAEGETMYLKDTANLSSGGTAKDVTDLIHPDNIFLAERIARLLGLNICGIDIIVQDITVPLTQGTGAVIEVNAGPGLRMHLSPAEGEPRDIAGPIIDMLYPGNTPSRIPIVAITGTNGKTTTTRLIAHFAKLAGHKVGYTTTDGIYIGDQMIHKGDCTGPASSKIVLRDSIVDFAVLECARGGILRSGLGFDKCDVSIVTNVTADHLGLADIDSIEELAKVKAVVPLSTVDNGYAILNADDDWVYQMRSELDCQIALFSISENNERIKRHLQRGGLAAFVENDFFTIAKSKWKTKIVKVTEVPLTFNGTAECMIKNILPALLAATIRGFSHDIIRKGLRSFIPGPAFTPGRMNIFKFPNFEVMVDYAHNTDGFEQLLKFLKNKKASKKVGIVGCPGDRRNEDIQQMGYYAAQMFDEIIIRHDKDGRGRSDRQLTRLIEKGIREYNSAMNIRVISDEIEALQTAINDAGPDNLIVVCTEQVEETIGFLREAKQHKEKNVRQRTVAERDRK